MIRNLLAVVLAALFLSSCSPKDQTSGNQDKDFAAFSNRFMDAYWKINPGAAMAAGIHTYDTLLIVPDSLSRKQFDDSYTAWLDSCKQFDENKLSENNRIDLWLIRDNLQAGLWYMRDFRKFEWDPSEYNVASGCAEIMNGAFAPLDSRLKTLAVRLRNVPAYYAAARTEIKKPTIEHTDLAILQTQGSVEEVFGKALHDSIAKSQLSADEKQNLNALVDTAAAQMKSFAGWLTTLRKNLNESNSRSFRIGRQLYDKKFEYDIVSGFTAEQIYDRAVKRRAELHTEMASLSRKLWPKYFGNTAMPSDSLQLIRKMIDTLSVHHVQPDSFLQSIEQQIPALEKFIKDKKLVYLDPTKPLVVRRTPAYMEGGGAGASISAPGPFEKNGKTYYNVSPLTGYTKEQAESYLREYNDYILQILNIHEAIPGHYTQLVYSNKSPSVIKSIFGNGAMVEGWAVYGERMMLENGYGNNEPEMWLMYYKWHLRSVCNTILDYSVHCLDMSEEDVMKLLTEGAFQQTAEAQGKWRRVKLTQVQLASYFTGFTEIYELREEMKQKQGDKFKLADFHDKFLSYGSAPVKYIRQLMLADEKPH